MAFNFQKIEAVKFGNFEVVPQMTAEAHLRLSQLKIDKADLDEAAKVIAECFGENAEKVEAFLKQNRLTMEYQRLQTYLLQGQRGLDLLEQLMKESVEANMSKAMAEVEADETSAE